MARILIIDDDETILATLAQLLATTGHSVVTADDGLAAEKIFRAEPFEVILTDIFMPNREGLETVIKLRREFPNVAVIAMSGGTAASRNFLEIAARLGAHRILEKPFTVQQLNAAIGSALAEAGRVRAGGGDRGGSSPPT